MNARAAAASRGALREYLLAENDRLRAMVQELIDALMGDLSDAEGIAHKARQLLKSHNE